MARSLLLLYVVQGLLPLICGQQRAAGPWRHRVQWQNNGQVYSLMSTGSEYQAPVRSRSQSRVYVSGRRDGSRSQVSGAHRGTMLVRTGQGESRVIRTDPGVEAGSYTPGRDGRPFVPVHAHASGARQQPERPQGTYPLARRLGPEHVNSINASAPRASADFPGRRGGVRLDSPAVRTAGGESAPGAPQLRAVPPAGPVFRQTGPSISASVERESEAAAPAPAPSEDASSEATTNRDEMVNDDPRNPFKNHRNSVFYNLYPSRERSGAQRPPGTGYGTRYFQNGKSHIHEFIIVNLHWIKILD